jgi:hypothetical protein
MASDGQYIIQYLGPHGWWVGHGGIDLRDPVAYARGVNKARAARIIDKETGEILGLPGCSICGEAHTGPDGGCLL